MRKQNKEEMKLLITGSREIKDPKRVTAAINEVIEKYGMPTEILHGGARGADQYAHFWADENGIKTTVIRPDYENHSFKFAPLYRNSELVKMTDVTVAIYNNNKRKGGTRHTADNTIKASKPLLECYASGRKTWTMPNLQLF